MDLTIGRHMPVTGASRYWQPCDASQERPDFATDGFKSLPAEPELGKTLRDIRQMAEKLFYKAEFDIREQWSVETEGPIRCNVAEGVNDTLFAVSDDGTLHAVDRTTGKEAWKTRVNAGVYNAPCAGNGMVYVAGWEPKLYALDQKTGDKKWEFDLKGALGTNAVIGENGDVYVRNIRGQIFVIDGETGDRKQVIETGKFGTHADALSAGPDGTVYSKKNPEKPVNGHDVFVAYDSTTGKEKWSVELPDFVYTSTPAVVDNKGTVYFGTNKGGGLYAIDGETGKPKWTFESKRAGISSPATIDNEGTVYFGCDNGALVAVNPETGHSRWISYTGEPIKTKPLITQRGHVVVGAGNQVVVMDKHRATDLWTFDTGDEITSTPVSGGRDMVYVGSNDGKLYAIREKLLIEAPGDEETQQETPGNSQSPKIAKETDDAVDIDGARLTKRKNIF